MALDVGVPVPAVGNGDRFDAHRAHLVEARRRRRPTATVSMPPVPAAPIPAPAGAATANRSPRNGLRPPLAEASTTPRSTRHIPGTPLRRPTRQPNGKDSSARNAADPNSVSMPPVCTSLSSLPWHRAPTPSGSPSTPMTFSIILSAACSLRVCAPCSSAPRSSSDNAVRWRSALMRAWTPILKKPGIREPPSASVAPEADAVDLTPPPPLVLPVSAIKTHPNRAYDDPPPTPGTPPEVDATPSSATE